MVTNTQSLHTGIRAVEQYIRDHLDEPLTREVLAAVAGFSVSHFHRVFTADTGENVAGYVRRVRLERAGRKLRMGAVDITESNRVIQTPPSTDLQVAAFCHSPDLDCWTALSKSLIVRALFTFIGGHGHFVPLIPI